MFDHLSLGVTDLDQAAAFYDACLEPLGYVRLFTTPRAVGYGPPGFVGEAPFAIVKSEAPVATQQGLHLAFRAPHRDAVALFHSAALKCGGTDGGPPGIREHYDPGYFAAFVRDPDGHRIEAVVHETVR